MLASLQLMITWLLIAMACGLAAWLQPLHGWAIAVSGGAAWLVLCWLGYASVLALEFVLSRRVNQVAGCPLPTCSETLTAWLHEALLGPVLFCWRQPFRVNAWPDQWAPAGPASSAQGAVFIHGFFCNRAFWNPWMARFQAHCRVHAAVSLEPVFGSIDDYVQAIADAVKRVSEVTRQPPLLVCHSMGGLAARAYLASLPVDAPAFHVVTIGTPHGGTWLARFGHSLNTRQMRLGSEWLASLKAPANRHRFTCWYSSADNIVFPSSKAMLAGADNRCVDGAAHVQMAFLPEVMNGTLALLDPVDHAVGAGTGSSLASRASAESSSSAANSR